MISQAKADRLAERVRRQWWTKHIRECLTTLLGPRDAARAEFVHYPGGTIALLDGMQFQAAADYDPESNATTTILSCKLYTQH